MVRPDSTTVTPGFSMLRSRDLANSQGLCSKSALAGVLWMKMTVCFSISSSNNSSIYLVVLYVLKSWMWSWGYNSVDRRMFAWQAQGSGFHPQHCIDTGMMAHTCSPSTRKAMQGGSNFKVIAKCVVSWRPSWSVSDPLLKI